MRRLWFPALLVVLALAVAAPLAAGEDDRPRLRAVLEDCRTGAMPAERVGKFMGAMPARAGTRTMKMRFDLQRREIGSVVYETMRDVPSFGRWERSEPGRRGFVFHKRVEALPRGYAYRAVVRFRWYDADGHRQDARTRRTPVCSQP